MARSEHILRLTFRVCVCVCVFVCVCVDMPRESMHMLIGTPLPMLVVMDLTVSKPDAEVELAFIGKRMVWIYHLMKSTGQSVSSHHGDWNSA